MSIKYSNIIASPSKMYPNWYYWFENVSLFLAGIGSTAAPASAAHVRQLGGAVLILGGLQVGAA
jgi:hypothetical protein